MSDPAARPLPIATPAQTRAEVRRAMTGHWWRLARIVTVLVAAAAAGLITPVALGGIVDAISDGTGPGRIWQLGGYIAAGALAAAVLTGIGTIGVSRLFETLLAWLRERMVRTALRLPQSTVAEAGTGDLINRAGDDVSQVSTALPQVLPAISQAGFTIALTFTGMAVLDWRYALALLAVVPVHVLTVRWYLRTAPGIYAGERAAMAARASQLLASLHGLETVLAFRLSRRHGGAIANTSWTAVQWAMRARIVQNRFFGRLNLAEYLGMTAILLVGFVMIGNDVGTIGGATTAMLMFLRLFDPINQLLIVVDDLQAATAALNRIVGVIRLGDDTRSVTKPGDRPNPADGGAAVTVRGLTFGYRPEHPVLCDIDLTIGATEHIALVGTSGAGKTTLAALIAGVHHHHTGRIIRPGAGDHRRPITLVTQETHVFHTTVRQNLTLARPDATDSDLRDALRRVEAESIVDGLPDGLDTVVGDHGHALTPADVQHLALARLILADPALAILDEATAEAGSSTSARLEHATEAAIAGRAAIVVAHRLSQAARADRVLVMDHGRIIESGPHTALVAAGGHYAALWRAYAPTA